MPSASATVSRVRSARQARPVRARRRFRQTRSVAAAAPRRMNYHARASVIEMPPSLGGSTTMPVEKPRRDSYSPPR